VRTTAFRPSLLVRLVMLAAAYSPLLLLLAVLNSFRLEWLRWVLLGLSVAGVLGTLLFLFVAIPRRNATPEVLTKAKPRDAEALKFFASYVVPFFVTTSAPPAARWGLLIYLLMIAVLYVQSDLYYSNPLLALLGYRVFEADRPDGGFLLLITRSWYLAPGQSRDLIPLGGYVHFDRTTRHRQRPSTTGR
jgi:hypothetical protein